MPRTAKVFMTNRSQAVRLPKEFPRRRRRRRCHRRFGRPHDEVRAVGALLRRRHVDIEARCGIELVMQHRRGDDDAPPIGGRCSSCSRLAEGIATGPPTLGQALADHDRQLGVEAVAVVEGTAAPDRNAHHLEVVGPDQMSVHEPVRRRLVGTLPCGANGTTLRASISTRRATCR